MMSALVGRLNKSVPGVLLSRPIGVKELFPGGGTLVKKNQRTFILILSLALHERSL